MTSSLTSDNLLFSRTLSDQSSSLFTTRVSLLSCFTDLRHNFSCILRFAVCLYFIKNKLSYLLYASRIFLIVLLLFSKVVKPNSYFKFSINFDVPEGFFGKEKIVKIESVLS